ncbi:MAG: helix-turn-helix domain-containing protein [Rhodospirillaceae bacterium]|nr:helix-turn-helix domain-containing protein [Rhodospirillaceae bacterium]
MTDSATPRAPAATISHYALYGEHAQDDDPEFVHIEDIRTRSRLYDWRITPHTHRRMFQIVYVIEGASTVWLDNRSRPLETPCAVCIPGGVVHGFTFAPDTVGWVLTVSDLMLIDARYRRSRKLFEPLFAEARTLSFAGNPEGAALMSATLEQLHAEFHWPRFGRAAMFEWLIRVVLMAVRRQLDQAAQPDRFDRRRDLYQRFRQLLEDHYRDHWPVAAYADALALSQPRLNRLCQALGGRRASDLIQDRVILEAQRHLIYTSATVSQIAYELGFQDPAYFSRAFSRRAGMAPGKFREARLAEPFPH